MNRREAIRNVVGAIVGVSVVPEFGQKPKLGWYRKQFIVVPPVSSGQVFLRTNFSTWRPYVINELP